MLSRLTHVPAVQVPFLSKVTDIPMAQVATNLILGKSLAEQGYKRWSLSRK